MPERSAPANQHEIVESLGGIAHKLLHPLHLPALQRQRFMANPGQAFIRLWPSKGKVFAAEIEMQEPLSARGLDRTPSGGNTAKWKVFLVSVEAA